MSVPNFINILASACFKSADGTSIDVGTLTVQAVDGTGSPLPFAIGGGGLAGVDGVRRSISGGSMVGTLQLANPAVSDPPSIGYTFSWVNAATGTVTTFAKVAITADGSGNFNLASLQAGSYTPAVPVQIIQGEPGESAYQVAVDEGFSGSKADWLASLVGPSGSLTGNVTGNLYVSGRVFEGADRLVDPNARQGEYWGATNGDIALGVFPDLGLTTDDNLQPQDSDVAYYSRSDGTHQQVFRFQRSNIFGAGVEQQLTTNASNNVFQSLSPDGTTVFFTSDRGGTSAPYYMTKYGLNQFPITTDVRKLFVLYHHMLTGQSLAVGAFSTPYLTVTQPFSNVMFNGGICPDHGDGISFTAVPSGNLTSFTPSIEGAHSEVGETICSNSANQITAALQYLGIRYTVLSSCNALGNTSYSGLCKGTGPYANGIAEVTAAQSIHVAQGYSSYGVRLINVVHGEADGSNSSYGSQLLQWYTDYNTDIKAITGQASDIPMFHSQPSSGELVSPYQIHLAHESYPGKVILVCPKYFLPYSTASGSGNIHLTNVGEQWLSEYYARANKEVILGREWQPLKPLSITRWGSAGTQVLVKFHVPNPPLVIDTSNVTEPVTVSGQKYGFEAVDGTGTLTITSVAPYGTSGTMLLITFNRAPASSPVLRYAYTVPSGGAAGTGRTTPGNRGNIRDSAMGLSSNGYPMWNWLIHFSVAIA